MKNTTVDISIIIPVYNEEKNINTVIDSIYNNITSKIIEIIVVDSHPGQTTLDAIKSKSSQVIKITSKKGRSIQMNKGAEFSSGNILVFLHADTLLPVNALNNIYDVIINKKYKAGAFDLGIISNKFILKIIAYTASCRSRFTKIPYGDQAIFIEKNYFFEIGKYSEIPLMEDVDFMKKIKRSKKKIFIIPDKVKTSPRKWNKEGWLYTTLRNWVIMTLYTFGVKPEKLVKYYYKDQ